MRGGVVEELKFLAELFVNIFHKESSKIVQRLGIGGGPPSSYWATAPKGRDSLSCLFALLGSQVRIPSGAS